MKNQYPRYFKDNQYPRYFKNERDSLLCFVRFDSEKAAGRYLFSDGVIIRGSINVGDITNDKLRIFKCYTEITQEEAALRSSFL